MVESLLLRWVLTALFALTGAWCGFRVLHPAGGWRERLSSASHVVMSLLMIAMAWPWGMALPAAPQIAVFTVAAAWFLVLTALRVPCGHLRRSGWLAHTHHAVMAGSMVWMVATMPLLMNGMHDSGGGGHHHALGAPASGVLAMPMSAGPPESVLLVSALLGAFLVLSALGWISSAVDTGRRSGSAAESRCALDAACHGAMSVGMGVMLFAVL